MDHGGHVENEESLAIAIF